MKQLHTFRKLFAAAAIAVAAFGFTSCEDEPNIPINPEARGPYDQRGVFIVNEGNYGTPTGSLSYLSDSAGHTVQNDVFKKANSNRPLGDVVQDMVIFEDRALIVINNSNKLEIVDAYTLKTQGVVNLAQPRYAAVLNKNKAYITEWVKYGEPGRVAVIDLNGYTVTKTITVGQMPEQLKIVNGRLYVAVSGDNKVVVINTNTDAIETTLDVADSPRELEVDVRNNLWVLSSGKTVYNPDWTVDYSKTTPGALSLINTAGDAAVSSTMTFGSNQSSPGQLTVNGTKDRLYFNYNGKTYSQQISNNTLSTTPILDRSFSGLGIDPETGNIYGSDNNGFSGDGTVFVYKPDGTKVNVFKVGVGPNGFVFN
ncbi:DUF5074 domain-containing protein [Pontibacter sp. H249]|uniref:DUF5074 domain-containing protein n=1 Tax=Pontibacter sp. H249 TaxID=3133420 RepID=UPI0030BD8E91